MNRLLAEALGTFGIVFAGTGAIIVNHATGGAVTHVGIALTFGLIVTAMILAFGETSGAHFNPAVSIAFALAGRFTWRSVPAYIVAQMLGALAASGLLRVLFSGSPTLGATNPAGPWWQSFVLEIILTFLLMLVILLATVGPREKTTLAPIAIGAVVALEAMFAGPICGASMNPARSLAPAVVSGDVANLWIYLTAPVLGALAAVPCARLVAPTAR
jgi:aquaporin NIP